MAGVRPQPRPGGGISSVHIWLIVFVVLWLGFAVATVLLAFRQEDLTNRAERAETERDSFITARERNQLAALIRQARDNKRSLAGELEFRRGELARRISGSQQDDLQTISKKIDLLLGQILQDQQVPDPAIFQARQGVALLDALQQMYRWFVEQKQQAEQAAVQLAALRKERDQAIAARQAQRQGFEQRLGELEAKIKQLEQRGAEFERQRNELQRLYSEARAKAERAYNENLRQLNDQLKSLQADKRRLERLVARQGQIIARFRPKTAALGLATQADGRVLTAVPGEDVVYIDIGRQARNPLTLGLTFEVYSADKPIPEGGKGKATIEVASIYSDTSACRVVSSTPGEPIVEGDYVVNPVYDRTRRYRFVVLGGFDLDGDGRDEPAEAEKVRSIIARWGGQVVETLDARTDFLVLGRKPAPGAPLSAAATAQQVEAFREAQRRAREYDRLLEEAKALRITILTQNQFLSFIGRSRGLAAAVPR
ncbi:MAG: hypothetical protein ACE5K7_06035 [Phycisphaerae bacterium]